MTLLPQPADTSRRYTYVAAEDLAERYFESSPLAKDQLVWVLTSQGRKKRKKGAVLHGSKNADGDEGSNAIRTELFLRARVVSEGDQDNADRILVRYPKGSTYRVRSNFLLPVLEPEVVTSDRIVLVVPETPDYRRASVVHTCVGESFLEIGCDYGMCVDRVRKALAEVGAVPLVATTSISTSTEDEQCNENANQDITPKDGNNNGDTSNGSNQVACLGVDKSPESIEIAMERYPKSSFSIEDALSDEGTAKMRALCKQKLIGGYPNVVAIDINGNRLLDHVLECVSRVMNPAGDDVVIGEDWDLPRLIIVKSRFLHEEVKRQQGRLQV